MPFGQQFGDQGEAAGGAPRVQQRGRGEQGHVQADAERAREVGHGDRRECAGAQDGVPAGELGPAPTAQEPAEDHRSGGAGQGVRGHRDRRPGAALPRWREVQRQPGHRDERHAVAQGGHRQPGQHPAQQRMAHHRPVGRGTREAGRRGGGGHAATRHDAGRVPLHNRLRAEGRTCRVGSGQGRRPADVGHATWRNRQCDSCGRNGPCRPPQMRMAARSSAISRQWCGVLKGRSL